MRTRRLRHPLREDVSWNANTLDGLCMPNAVILFVRMWVEMLLMKKYLPEWCRSSSSWGCELKCSYLLSMILLYTVILFVRMWVEILILQWYTLSTPSSSSWGCELKYLCVYVKLLRYGHPLREDVSWNVDISTSDSNNLVILFVRMWVEMEMQITEKAWVESSSSWGCELKYHEILQDRHRSRSSSSWGCELKFMTTNPVGKENWSSSSWGCELK